MIGGEGMKDWKVGGMVGSDRETKDMQDVIGFLHEAPRTARSFDKKQ